MSLKLLRTDTTKKKLELFYENLKLRKRLCINYI